MRQIRIENEIAYVPLTRGYEAIIDVADVPLIQGLTWTALVRHRSVYAYRVDCSGGNRRGVLMHRLLMNDPEGMEIDHCDGNGLLNRRSNLRVATKQQNRHNARIRRDNTSGFKGVVFNKNDGRWHSRIMIDNKRQHLGSFGCPTAAHFAYVKANAKLHGIFGRVV